MTFFSALLLTTNHGSDDLLTLCI